MVRNQRPLPIDINQTVRLRREAAGLLRRLESNLQADEQICAEIGKCDAMRFITGRSAIERAIETTRGMIRNMDHLLEEAEETIGGPIDGFAADQDERANDEQNAEHLVESR